MVEQRRRSITCALEGIVPSTIKCMLVVGAHPHFTKAAPIISAIQARTVERSTALWCTQGSTLTQGCPSSSILALLDRSRGPLGGRVRVPGDDPPWRSLCHVRENIGGPVTITSGTNVIAGTTSDGIRHAIPEQLGRDLGGRVTPHIWDGTAAKSIITILVDEYQARRRNGGH